MEGSHPLVGRALGDFIVREQIGEGGFGAVFRAEQPLLGREAVVKVSTGTGSTEYVDRFLKEARLASKLDHPYAAHIYAFGSEDDGTLWTAMELVRGTPLDRLIQHQGPLKLPRFVPLFDKLCEVVHTAHEQGIIHRDLKPSNVMVLSRAGRLLPKLLDLGIAKGDTDEAARSKVNGGGDGDVRHTRAGKFLGSPAYMAPEQWVDARKADARTDVYALGILAFEVLTGKLPFTGTSVTEVARQHARASAPPLGGEFPAALDTVIAKALAKKPGERYATTLELATAMHEAAALPEETARLPELDPFLREEVLAAAPQPIAEAVAAIDGARSVHQAQAAIVGVVRVIARLLGNLALVSWATVPRDARGGDPDDITTLLRELRQSGLVDTEWVELARAIARRFGDRRELFPIPELVGLLVPAEGATSNADLDALLGVKTWFDAHLGASESAMLEQLALALPRLERVLRELAWLSAYAFVSVEGERWNGVRRPHRARVELREKLEGEGPVLLDPDGAVVVSLAPLFAIAAPAPGHARELFVLDGANRDGARLVSLPTGFEKTSEQAWAWLGERVKLAEEKSAEHDEQKPPYRGLATFTTGDAEQFVGREQETEAFVNRLRITPLLVVVGASGAGKSSFVQAGVVPALGDAWKTVIVRPGATPTTTLKAALVRALELDEKDVAIERGGLARILKGWIERERGRAKPGEAGRSVLLYIDQLEELFTLCHDSAERERYASALIHAADDPDAPVRVVATIRDDFLLRCQQVQALRESLAGSLQLLATPTPADLERILVEPAKRVGYELEDEELAREMVKAVADLPAALPLLSFTASQMWELRDRHHRRLSRKAYETLGGVGGALAQHAERVFAQMSTDEQKLVRVAFRNLVTADGTRAVLTRAELLEITGSPAIAETVLEQLIGARLLTASEGDGVSDRVEVVHEALLGAWPRLIEWRREDAEGARLRDQLRGAARQWHDRGRPRGLLWRAEALTEYQLWRARHPGQLIAVEEDFGAASLREAARGRRLRNAAVGTIVGVLVVGMVVALVLYRQAESQRVLAADNEQKAIANESRANDLVLSGYVTAGQRAALAGDSNQALVYLAAARQGGVSGVTVDIPIAEARRGLLAEHHVYRGHEGKVLSLAVTPDGKRFATGGADHLVNVWDVDREQVVFRLADSPASVNLVQISRDGRWLASAALDGHVRIYELATGKLAHDLALDKAMLFCLRFTPDSQRVVAFSENQEIGVWDAATGAVVKRFKSEGDGVGWGDLSPDGRLLAVPSYDRQLRIYDITTGKLERTLGPHDDTVWGVAFSPDGKLIVTASWDKTAKLWTLPEGKLVSTLIGASAALDLVAWSDDASLVATGGRDGSVRLWNRAGQLVTTLGCGGLVHDMKWTRDGQRLAVACGDKAVVFDVAAGLPLFRRQATGAGVFALQLLPDGDVLSAEADGTGRRWTPTTNLTFSSRDHEGAIQRLDRCHDGSLFTSSEDHSAKGWRPDGTITWRSPANVADAVCSKRAPVRYFVTTDGALWSSEGDAAPVKIVLAKPLPGDAIIGLSPDETRLAIVDKDNRALLVELGDRTIVDGGAATFGRTWEPKLAWAGDGSVFALMSDAGAVVWDGRTAERRFEVLPPGGLVRRILLDVPTQSMFVSSMSPDVRRFSLADGAEVARYKSPAFAWGMTVIGTSVYIGFDNGSVIEYDVASAKQLRVLAQFPGDAFSLADGGHGLLWIGTADLSVSLVDLASRAILFRASVPTDPMLLSADDRLGAVIAGLSGKLAFVQAASTPVDAARLALEVRCRATQTLRNGTLEPHAVELDACAELSANGP